MSLDDVVFNSMTARDALKKCFKDDWNARRDASNAVADQPFEVTLMLSSSFPASLAKKVLDEVLASEALARSERPHGND